MRLGAAVLCATLLGMGEARAAHWVVDPAKSRLGFAGTQVGATFTGTFRRFSADIEFDPAAPAAAHVKVDVDTGSATTGDAQRDQSLPQPEWFDVKQFPHAIFEATGFRPLGGDRYETTGTLTIRNVKAPLTLPFTLTIAGATAHAAGGTQLVRTKFGVGQGDWSSGDMVGLDVKVEFDLVATKAP